MVQKALHLLRGSFESKAEPWGIQGLKTWPVLRVAPRSIIKGHPGRRGFWWLRRVAHDGVETNFQWVRTKIYTHSRTPPPCPMPATVQKNAVPPPPWALDTPPSPPGTGPGGRRVTNNVICLLKPVQKYFLLVQLFFFKDDTHKNVTPVQAFFFFFFLKNALTRVCPTPGTNQFKILTKLKQTKWNVFFQKKKWN